MKTTLAIVTLFLWSLESPAMIGSPVFCVGPQMTGMTVIAAQSNVGIPEQTEAESHSAASQRLLLVARYGVAPYADIGATVGTANLKVGQSSSGYSDFDANWSLAWGANARAGYPMIPRPYQFNLSVNYLGFQPKAASSNGMKSVQSEYLWHELWPTATFGWRFESVIPYAGLTKPILFGKKDVQVTFNGRQYPSAGGTSNYQDGKQPIQGILGVEWRFPAGYALTAEAHRSSGAGWMLAIGLAQILR